MSSGSQPRLEMPSFLRGPTAVVQAETEKEGRQCAEQYRSGGSFVLPGALVELAPGEVVIAHEVVDFWPERPAWRLHMVWSVVSGICDVLDWQDSFQVSDVYEAVDCQAAWGALYFTLSRNAPGSAR